MILPTDIPTRAQLERLLAARDPSSVSIYLPTDPSSTFPHTAFVLALSQSRVRLLEIAPDLESAEIDVPDLPKNVASAVGNSQRRASADVADVARAATHGLVDEIARRAWLTGGRVLAVRRDDIPGDGPVAAMLRYAP